MADINWKKHADNFLEGFSCTLGFCMGTLVTVSLAALVVKILFIK